MPNDVVERLKEGGTFLETLQSKQAIFHKSCRSKYNKTIIDRVKKSNTNIENTLVIEHNSTKRTLRTTCSTSTNTKVCFFCNKPATDNENLHVVATLQVESRIRDGAEILARQDLLIKLAIGDLVAQEASYHKNCLTKFNNQVRSVERNISGCETDFINLAFAELVMYMESCSEEVYKLSELRTTINDRLKQLQGDNASSISSHRLQEKLLKHFPTLRCHTDQPKPTILAFEKNIETIVRDAAYQEDHGDFIDLARAANICRGEMFKLKDTKFSGSLIKDMPEAPLSLLTLIRMLLHGSSILDQKEEHGSHRML